MKKFIYYFILVLVFIVFGFVMYQLGKGNLSFDFSNKKNIVDDRDLETISCNIDSDCVATNKQCINKNYKEEPNPDIIYMGTDEFSCSAAYHDSDCLCQKGICVNDRIKNPDPSC